MNELKLTSNRESKWVVLDATDFVTFKQSSLSRYSLNIALSAA